MLRDADMAMYHAKSQGRAQHARFQPDMHTHLVDMLELEIDLRHALEMCVALRESHRQERVPLRLPLEDRSLTMYPERARWHYKKQIIGEQVYMEQMRGQKQD